ncbi:dTDP-4-dehydrorhamnose reductase [Candidatus Nitrotoga sp. HW29]|uniref:dTDP-4-dehydrorhamnose reductase n=1 Tax=Candidatus Nitrotoga sp. HW29 TaxID=2886963 RepID=UPI001EF32EE5|nr:dTDP-4-dehydrorhamnose reductase [Candidatus Nitrotoga sp. HW29]CAH1905782.1 dTDP-4-dehydrorhamnose reductase [Candidatus Nitrotoga sp. HW29]
MMTSQKPVILLFGKNGQVGFELQRALSPFGLVHAFDRQDCDLAQLSQVREIVRQLRPDIIVNASAYTAVDKAESEPQIAHLINATLPGVLAEEAAAIDALLVHYSTDYVFDGKQSGWYEENDIPNPQSVYGTSKLAGERGITATNCRNLIFRTSWVFGAHGGNFAKTILRLAKERESLNVIADQFGAPTSAHLIADVTAQVIVQYWNDVNRESFPYGIYHLVAAGETTWYEYAKYVIAYAEKAGIELRLKSSAVEAIPSINYPLPAPRPSNSRLDSRKLRQTFNLTLPDWRQDMVNVLAKIITV